ncbi:hypothetical protein TNCV_2014701 [Trichonephila clavipes]|nr:hypothetical protein TNCV_2014701 [Trichonephila clavipes]
MKRTTRKSESRVPLHLSEHPEECHRLTKKTLTLLTEGSFEANVANAGAISTFASTIAISQFAISCRHIALGAFPPGLTATRAMDVATVATTQNRTNTWNKRIGHKYLGNKGTACG